MRAMDEAKKAAEVAKLTEDEAKKALLASEEMRKDLEAYVTYVDAREKRQRIIKPRWRLKSKSRLKQRRST